MVFLNVILGFAFFLVPPIITSWLSQKYSEKILGVELNPMIVAFITTIIMLALAAQILSNLNI